MTRTSKIFIYICMVGLAAFYACSDKETPQPVEDTARVDALRQELSALQTKVLGKATAYSSDSVDVKTLEAQIAKLNEQLAKSVGYSVYVTDLQGNALAGATVKVTQGGKVATATTDASGTASFPDMYGGYVFATADASGFASLAFTADIRNYDTNLSYTGASHVSLVPVDGSVAAAAAGMFTYNINLYANYTIVDDTLGGPAYWGPDSDITKALPAGPNPNDGRISYSAVTDKKISIVLDPNSLVIDDFWFTTDGVGEVIDIAHVNTTITVSSAGANGVYEVKIPANGPGGSIDYTISYEEFTHDFTRYVDNGVYGTSPKIHGPFSETVTTSKIWRIYYESENSAPGPLSVRSASKFYYYQNN